MRRKRINSGTLRSWRSGVMESVMTRKRRVQSPVACWMNSSGLGMVWPRTNGQMMAASGPRHKRNRRALVHLLTSHLLERRVCTQRFPLVILAQIHTGVQAGDLIGVAVEHQSFMSFEEFGEAALASLAPAGMIDFGIHVGIEAVLLRGIEIPRSGRLVFDKTNFH